MSAGVGRCHKKLGQVFAPSIVSVCARTIVSLLRCHDFDIVRFARTLYQKLRDQPTPELFAFSLAVWLHAARKQRHQADHDGKVARSLQTGILKHIHLMLKQAYLVCAEADQDELALPAHCMVLLVSRLRAVQFEFPCP